MTRGSSIQSIRARQVFSERRYPGVETTVTTENGASATAVVVAGASTGVHEVQFAYDGGKRWKGKGATKAVSNVNDIIAPALIGKDAVRQGEIDNIIIELDGTKTKAKLGGNATASVSAAVLKAGAASLGIPLYQHIGGVNANRLPPPGVRTFGGPRFGGGEQAGTKPSHSFIAYGFDTFSEASYACWNLHVNFGSLMQDRYPVDPGYVYQIPHLLQIPPGMVESTWELWDIMAHTIDVCGYQGKVGMHIDVAAATYYEEEKQAYVGLFSKDDKTRDDMIEMYKAMLRKYPIVVLEDPLDEEDYEGHAVLTRELGIQIVGDDLFTTSVDRLMKGVGVGACNAVLVKVNQIGTISEAFDTVQLAHKNSYGVMPCSSRGEGVDIADYSVGLGAGTVRECGVGPSANRFLAIEAELGARARFLGIEGLKTGTSTTTVTKNRKK